MAEIILYGIIGDPDDGLDAKTVTAAIRAAEGDLDVRINSPGGYVFGGLPIYEALAAYDRGKVTTYIDGLAASMASVVAMAGAEIVMAESALMMVHKPWDSSIGNADELRKDAAKLDKMEQQLVGIYSRRTGIPTARISALLAAETWFSADEARAAGFATTTAPTLKLAAMADLSAFGFRNTPASLKGRTMPDPVAAPAISDPVMLERKRVTEINSLCAKHKLGGELAAHLVEKGVSLDDAREVILDRLAARTDIHSAGLSGPMDQTFDNPDFLNTSLSDALYARLSGKAPSGAALEFMSMGMIDMAAEMLERRGMRGLRRMRPDEILNAAAWNGGRGAKGSFFAASSPAAAITHTSGDFPDLLQASGQRYLQEVFMAAASPLKAVGRERLARDFRAISGLQLSNFGTLPQVNEGGEIKSGTFTSRKETYSLATFGKQFSITRQAIINDDLGAFRDPMTIMGRAAAETEATQLAALVNSNPTMSDGVALFHATHGNLRSAAAPTVDSLDTARQAMRGQKDLDTTTPINAAPKFILSSPGVETTIERLVSIPLNATQVDETNPFAGKLTPLVDPRLPGTAWYLFADPDMTPVIEYAYLNGETGPIVEQQAGWDVLGQAFRVYMDFGCGIVDYRGAYKFPATS